MGKGVNCMVRDHTVVYTDVELQCCTPETYIINILKAKKKKELFDFLNCAHECLDKTAENYVQMQVSRKKTLNL